MDWDVIGAVAEIVGAAAVIVTLIYLAIQTRDNVKVLRARAVWDAQASFVEVNEILCQGCGSCMATCPKQGIYVAGFSLDQLNAQVDAALGVV